MKKIIVGTIGVILAASVCFADSFTSAWTGGVISNATRAVSKNYSTVGVQSVRIVCVDNTGAAKPCKVSASTTGVFVPIPSGDTSLVLNKTVNYLKFNTYTTTTRPTNINIIKQ